MNAAKIEYSNGTGVYYCNEELCGRLILDMKRPLRIKSINIRIKGKASVWWTESSNDSSTSYASKEKYIDVYVSIFNRDSEVQFDAGNHIFNFSYLLPPSLPATYKNPTGRVYYSCEAIIESSESKSFFRHKRKTKKPFTVIPDMNVESLPDAHMMITRQRNKVLYAFCCFSLGILRVSLCVDRGAYSPGDRIRFNVEISNRTSLDIKHMSAKLKRKVICKAQRNAKTMCENTVISGCRNTASASPFENYVWKNAEIPVPYTPPTDLGGCNIISVTYTLRIVIGTDWNCGSSKVKFKIPLIIGTLPKHATHLLHDVTELQKFLLLNSVVNSQSPNVNNGPTNHDIHLW